MAELRDNQAGHCWSCGYQLRGVESDRCPECGRPFDRADRSTMNFGRPMGPLGRRMLAPLGRPTTVAAILGCALVCATARWPVEGWRFSLLDLGYYGQIRHWRERWPTLTGVDAAYMVGLTLWSLLIVVWVVRLGLRLFAVARYRPPRFQRGRLWTPSLWLLLWLLFTYLGVGAGWPHRIGQRWAANVLAPNAGNAFPQSKGLQPRPMTPDQELAALRSAVTQGATPRLRTAGLKLLFETRSQDAAPILTAAFGGESDPDVAALELRLLAMLARPDTGPFLAGALADPRPAVRAAAADALGIWRDPPFPIGWPSASWVAPQTRTDPPITVMRTFTVDRDGDGIADPPSHVPPAGARDALERMMLSGPTLAEREAAARALVNWPPPNYRLRYAEWGVFAADPAGNVAFTKAQFDEIPPFVHRIGNPAKELESRIEPPNMNVWKPVIHLTADRPMAVDIDVCIQGGRPWVVYPKIDDLSLLMNGRQPAVNVIGRTRPYLTQPGSQTILDVLDPTDLSSLTDLREGYPWLTPEHRKHSASGWRVSGAGDLGAVGVRWQSLIVSPTKLGWMSPADVGPDPRFAWWQRLRDVDCSWVSNRGQSERFLYYDGPTIRPAPVRVELENDGLHVFLDPNADRDFPRRGLYVEVSDRGVSTQWVNNLDRTFLAPFARTSRTPQQAADELTAVIQAQGLTPSETAGLLACWRPAFLETRGRRFLAFMSERDYDDACPMQIRPAPTELARVGIVWTEFKQ